MKKKFKDINDLVSYLAVSAMSLLLSDEMWQLFGYKKCPKRGSKWSELFPKKFQLEDLITEEILTMVLIDTLCGIKKSSVSYDTKLLISIGVIDRFISTMGHKFEGHSLMKNLFNTYASFLQSEKSKLHIPIITKGKEILSAKDFSKFLVGITYLVGTPQFLGSYLLNTEDIVEAINNSSTTNRLSMDLSKEFYQEYAELVAHKILDT